MLSLLNEGHGTGGTGEGVFLKRVRRVSADKDGLEREMRIYEELMRLNTTHVLQVLDLQVLDFIRDDEFVALVTEYADGGDLHNSRRSPRKSDRH